MHTLRNLICCVDARDNNRKNRRSWSKLRHSRNPNRGARLRSPAYQTHAISAQVKLLQLILLPHTGALVWTSLRTGVKTQEPKWRHGLEITNSISRNTSTGKEEVISFFGGVIRSKLLFIIWWSTYRFRLVGALTEVVEGEMVTRSCRHHSAAVLVQKCKFNMGFSWYIWDHPISPRVCTGTNLALCKFSKTYQGKMKGR
jgi:hypothetical protein